MGVFKKFWLLLWKNWLFRKRQLLSTIFSLIVAIFLAALLLYVRDKIGDDFSTYETEFTNYREQPLPMMNYSLQVEEEEEDEDEESSNLTRRVSGGNKILYYTPDNDISRDLLFYVMQSDNITAEFKPVKDEDEIGVPDFDKVMAGILFVGLRDSLPTKLHCRLRVAQKKNWNTDVLLSLEAFNEPSVAYYNRIFILLQHLIAIRFIEMSGNNTNNSASNSSSSNGNNNYINNTSNSSLSAIRIADDSSTTDSNPSSTENYPSTSTDDSNSSLSDNNSLPSGIMFATQKFPYPPHFKEQGLAPFLRFLLPLFIIICYLFVFPPLIKNIVSEKETGIKELMRIMGFPTWLQWCAWYVSTFIMAIIILIILLLLWLVIKNVLPNTATELFILLLILYITSSISFCLFFSTFFSKPSIATSCSVIVIILTFFVPHFAFTYKKLSYTSKIFFLLLPNMALTWVIQYMVDFEVKNIGLNWDNIDEPSTFKDNVTALHIFGLLVVDTILYWVLAWYLDNVLPSVYGIRKPFYFLFLKDYWCPATGSRDNVDDESIENPEDFEADPEGLTPLVEVVHLTKKFGRGQTAYLAVNNLMFNMYEGQITGLLGHNGAGKTTTMSMLTGMIPPTSGTAYINGFDIRTQMDAARQDLGLCPQHNMLFNNLTCQEHLTFFGGLKISSRNELSEEVDLLLTKLQLSEKRNTKVKNLSGGMKRKVNLGIALIGHPKVIMLDEPTSGLDPEARRAIWDVIQEHREGCCIVLSTHFMDEADALSDRIAIMASGKVVCVGSPSFLKKQFGAGYHLYIVKSKDTKVNRITRLVNKHIDGANMASNKTKEVSFDLPASETPHFANFLKDLESNISEYGIIDFGLSISTVEDVFLKVGEITAGDTTSTLDGQSVKSSITLHTVRSTSTQSETPLIQTGLTLKLKQIVGLILKRWYYAKRRWLILIFQILIPVLIIILGIKLGEVSLDLSPYEPPLVMNLAQYSTYTFITEENDITVPWYEWSLPRKVSLIVESDPENLIKEVAVKNYLAYVEELILGATVTNSSMIAWYNGLYYHTEPLSLNILHNTLLKYVTNDDRYEIVVENAPFSRERVIPDYESRLFQILIIGIYFPLALSFITSTFVIFPIHERATMCKQLQMMTGVGGILFWGVSFVWDFIIHAVCSCILILIIIIFDVTDLFTEDGKMGLILLFLLLYGWSGIPFTYLMSLTTKFPALGFTRLILINVICGIIITIALFILSNIDEDKSSFPINFMVFISRILPSFLITFALMKIAFVGSMKSIFCSGENMDPKKCADLEYSKWEFPGVYAEVVALILTGFFYFILLALYECNVFERIWYVCCICCRRKTNDNDEDAELDPDVAKEKERVHWILDEGDEENEVLLVNDLTKRFGTFTAVRGLNFALEKEDCFGLIGINGAGKTTTFQMLTANLTITKGDTRIFGIRLKKNRFEYLRNVGYCPQFDPLIDYLSGREMLIVFAYLRGIKKSVIKETLDEYIKDFDLQDHAKKITRVYSGGNKRKLSLAIAFMGEPPLVFLDEPTTGVDPVARRKIRDVLSDANENGTCVVLTSHSMEECEALCTRVGIMVKGQFRCFGGIQYLKNKFSEGYVIFARMKRSGESAENSKKRQMDFQNYIESKFPSAVLSDFHQGLVQYQVNDKNVKWSYMFETMEKAKFIFNLEDYTISQTSLDQVFLSFAREE